MAENIIDFPEAAADEDDERVTLFQVKATLLESDPVVWRRLLIPAQVDFDTLATFLTMSFNWSGMHLYEFEKGKDFFDDPRMEDEGMPQAKGERHYDALEKQLDQELLPGDAVRFVYDFGDYWELAVEVERETMIDELPVPYFPVCVGGEGAAPPEDVGGQGGYEHFLGVINDEEGDDGKDMREWAGLQPGEVFDPEFFDPLDLNSLFAYDMIDAAGDEVLPTDPQELQRLCKELLADKMALTTSLVLDFGDYEMDEDDDEDW